jgi:hypothetical protein
VSARTGLHRALVALVPFTLGACATTEPHDYALFHAHMPRSVIVLPPLDNTLEVEATYAYLSTVTQPLAEQGYYVFPVAVVDRMLRDNGLSGPGEMHAAPIDRLREVFGADAVLYVTLQDWGTSYRVLDSATEVTVEAHLVDLHTGTEIWSGTRSAVVSSSAGSSDVIGMLVGAVVNQIATSVSDPSRDVARDCNAVLFCNPQNGLLRGPHHPEYVAQ